jgi:alpha-amylase
VWQGDDFVPVRVEKQLTIVAGSCSLPITYVLSNMSDHPIATRFGPEFCFGLLAGHSDSAYYRHRLSTKAGVEYLDSRDEVETKEIALVNEFLGMEVALRLNAPTRVWRAPIETINLSEAGFERVYQSSSVMPLWDVRLNPRENWRVALEFELVANRESWF